MFVDKLGEAEATCRALQNIKSLEIEIVLTNLRKDRSRVMFNFFFEGRIYLNQCHTYIFI